MLVSKNTQHDALLKFSKKAYVKSDLNITFYSKRHCDIAIFSAMLLELLCKECSLNWSINALSETEDTNTNVREFATNLGIHLNNNYLQDKTDEAGITKDILILFDDRDKKDFTNSKEYIDHFNISQFSLGKMNNLESSNIIEYLKTVAEAIKNLIEYQIKLNIT